MFITQCFILLLPIRPPASNQFLNERLTIGVPKPEQTVRSRTGAKVFVYGGCLKAKIRNYNYMKYLCILQKYISRPLLLSQSGPCRHIGSEMYLQPSRRRMHANSVSRENWRFLWQVQASCLTRLSDFVVSHDNRVMKTWGKNSTFTIWQKTLLEPSRTV